MNHRFSKNDAAPYSSEEAFQGIHSRIRRPMEALMPDDWYRARLFLFSEIAETNDSPFKYSS